MEFVRRSGSGNPGPIKRSLKGRIDFDAEKEHFGGDVEYDANIIDGDEDD